MIVCIFCPQLLTAKKYNLFCVTLKIFPTPRDRLASASSILVSQCLTPCLLFSAETRCTISCFLHFPGWLHPENLRSISTRILYFYIRSQSDYQQSKKADATSTATAGRKTTASTTARAAYVLTACTDGRRNSLRRPCWDVQRIWIWI